MMSALDLTPRQAARVLEQALRNRADLELEQRGGSGDRTLRGRLVAREAGLLSVELHDEDRALTLATLVGAFCDVRTVLSGELYLFSTCIVDVSDASVPQRVLLAVPSAVQVANRRRFERKSPGSWAQARLAGGPLGAPQLAPILSISAAGLACRVLQPQLDEVLLIGDEILVGVRLPGHAEFFELRATVCNKSLPHDKSYLDLGLEFSPDPGDPRSQHVLQRLQDVLCDIGTDTTTDGET
jgi:hypothetical protein